ncbi:MAG: hypothetical protein FWG48_04625 [Oscillospiraceae bacterium]|nr:hypothetical protein [Oscillospiraceae bacterium]
MSVINVRVKFVAGELTPGLESGEYSICEGSTIRDLISECETACGAAVPPGNFKLMYPLLNGKPAQLDTAIAKSATVHICRVVMGG